MPVEPFQELNEGGHEQVTFFHNEDLQLTVIVAVHSTVLGPGLGGARMREYPSIQDAFYDVLRLSEGMTYKNALCGINFGGGKSVLIKDRALVEGREQVFRQFGKWVESVGGKYITAEDMGTKVEDIAVVSKETSYAAGRDPNAGGGGDPSPYTALGVFEGMKACMERVYGSHDFEGKRVAVQGTGHVGSHLCRHLAEAGASLVACDTRENQVEEIRNKYGAEVVSPAQIYDAEVDIFSPCAAGAIVNPDTVARLKCKIVAGAANNPLSDDGMERELAERDILYAPDFAINSGGVMLCADEFEPGGFTESRVLERTKNIYHTIGAVLDRAKEKGNFPGETAVMMAKERIQAAKSAR